MKVISIGSGSKGNATLINIDGTYILVDDGFSVKEMERRLLVSPNEIGAILLTHDHSDHLSGVGELSKKYDIEVHIPDRLVGLRKSYLQGAKTISHVDGEWEIGGIKVTQFRLPHDATYTVGYKIVGGSESFAIITDLGGIRDSIIDNIKGVDTIVLESNYDAQMLENGPYPIQLKRRIMSPLGHISNDEAGEIAVQLSRSGTKKIILAHISENNNIPELAYDTVGKKLLEKGLKPTLYFAEQSKVKIF